MPEKPEVITVARKLEKKLINTTITSIEVYHDNMIDYPSVDEIKKSMQGKSKLTFWTPQKFRKQNILIQHT